MKIEVDSKYVVDFTTCSKKDVKKPWTLVSIAADKGYDKMTFFMDEVVEVEKGDKIKITGIDAVTLGTESYEDKHGDKQYKKVVTINGTFKVV